MAVTDPPSTSRSLRHELIHILLRSQDFPAVDRLAAMSRRAAATHRSEARQRTSSAANHYRSCRAQSGSCPTGAA